jgi:antiviral defense system Shedu protein SduA
LLHFHSEDNKLILSYEPERGFRSFQQRLENGESVTIRKTFTFTTKDVLKITDGSSGIANPDSELIDSGVFEFLLARLDQDNQYFEIPPRILGIEKSVFFDKRIELKREYFIAVRDISVFKRISKILLDDIHIGFGDGNLVQFDTFKNLIKKFPNTVELDKYANMRVANVLREEFDGLTDAKELYEKYRNRRVQATYKSDLDLVADAEKIKYSFQHEKLTKMLQNEYPDVEKIWQHEILRIIEAIFPKYVTILEEVEIDDVVTGRKKRIDYLLVDSVGHIDLIEIKRPYSNPIVTKTKYRENYVPLRELSGTIMQVEKYIYCLNKWSVDGERKLTSRYRDRLPSSLDIKIVNPQGLIIMGRDSSISKDQKEDFELIKRKYKNILDIITYDDLLRRLGILVQKFSGENESENSRGRV